RLRLCRGVRHRTQIPRDAPLPGGARVNQLDPGVSRGTCVGIAKVVLGELRRMGRAKKTRLQTRFLWRNPSWVRTTKMMGFAFSPVRDGRKCSTHPTGSRYTSPISTKALR